MTELKRCVNSTPRGLMRLNYFLKQPIYLVSAISFHLINSLEKKKELVSETMQSRLEIRLIQMRITSE